MRLFNTIINKQLVIDIFRDAGKVVKGLFSIFWYGISKDKISVSLSVFRTNSQVVKQGDNCTYEIGICNISKHSITVKFLFDIYLKENPVHPNGHYGYFEKSIFVQAHKSQDFRIIYDWKDYAVIDIDDITLEPDVFWCGECESKGKFIVRALLLDEKGETFDELTLVQNLSE
jgi:hypothetical protein